jgi:hypothetical protein
VVVVRDAALAGAAAKAAAAIRTAANPLASNFMIDLPQLRTIDF